MKSLCTDNGVMRRGEQMFKRFTCKYCGKDYRWEESDYDMGLYLAQVASFEALGHIEHVTPYLICEHCSKEIKDSEK